MTVQLDGSDLAAMSTLPCKECGTRVRAAALFFDMQKSLFLGMATAKMLQQHVLILHRH